MKIVLQRHEVEESIKKSRFIGIIKPCGSETDALLFIKQLHEEYADASHIVFAYRIQSPDGLIGRFHDAGEPSGTAGKPIFQHLEGKQLINLVLVVIRYFGGVKLGAGGLTRAYGNIARQAIESAEIAEFIETVNLRLTLDYNQLQALDYQLKKLGGEVLQQSFAEQVVATIKVPKKHADTIITSFQ